jgi:hypothetical protein
MTSTGISIRRQIFGGLAATLFLGCGDDGGESASGSTGQVTTVTPTLPTGTTEPTSEATLSASTSSASAETSAGTQDGTGSSTGDVKFDLPVFADMGVPQPTCKVVDDMDAVGDCTDKAPPDAFEPEVQWTFMGPPGFDQCIVMPLVANLTDDNGDGAIDLCDVPDVVIVAGPGGGDTPPARLYVLDGLTGVEHFFAPELVQFGGTPALGDIDGDGLAEIVALAADQSLVAFEHDGTLKWKSAALVMGWQSSAVGMADIDEDGTSRSSSATRCTTTWATSCGSPARA